MHQPGPLAPGVCVHRQDVEAAEHPLSQPSLQLFGLCGILLAGDLDAGLDLADGHR